MTQESNAHYTTVRVSQDAHEKIIRFAGHIQSELGQAISLSDALEYLLDASQTPPRARNADG